MTTVTFTAATSDVWPCPSGVSAVQVEVWGAGGGGNGAEASGGGGEYAANVSVPVTYPNSYVYTVGAAGAGGSGSAGNGGNSSFNGDGGVIVTGQVIFVRESYFI